MLTLNRHVDFQIPFLIFIHLTALLSACFLLHCTLIRLQSNYTSSFEKKVLIAWAIIASLSQLTMSPLLQATRYDLYTKRLS